MRERVRGNKTSWLRTDIMPYDSSQAKGQTWQGTGLKQENQSKKYIYRPDSGMQV